MNAFWGVLFWLCYPSSHICICRCLRQLSSQMRKASLGQLGQQTGVCLPGGPPGRHQPHQLWEELPWTNFLELLLWDLSGFELKNGSGAVIKSPYGLSFPRSWPQPDLCNCILVNSDFALGLVGVTVSILRPSFHSLQCFYQLDKDAPSSYVYMIL